MTARDNVESWVESGHIADAILFFTTMEWLGVSIYHRRTGRGPTPMQIASILLPGMCLLVALRLALVGSGWVWIATALTGALVAHLADLARRWQQ